MTTRVFVYGTLRKGEANHRLLVGSKFVGPAATRPEFKLLDVGPYPLLVAGEKTVVGEVYEVDARTLVRLDVLEGHPSYYRRTPVILADGTEAQAYVFARTEGVVAPEITSGDWVLRGERAENPLGGEDRVSRVGRALLAVARAADENLGEAAAGGAGARLLDRVASSYVERARVVAHEHGFASVRDALREVEQAVGTRAYRGMRLGALMGPLGSSEREGG